MTAFPEVPLPQAATAPQPADDRAAATPATNVAALLQLASSTLPVGAFSHSLGLEAAHDAGLLRNSNDALRWIGDHLQLVWANGEAPWWLAAFTAWRDDDADGIAAASDWLVASRETAELRLEHTQTGRSLRQWLLGLPDAASLTPTQRTTLGALDPPAFACVHALAAYTLGLDARTGLHAQAWSTAENLVMAALKLVPLGQAAAQTVLRQLAPLLPACIDRAFATPPMTACNFAPMLAILSSRHETQYSRLFRS